MQLEQAGQQFFLNVTGPHTLEPRQGRAGHSPHMVRICRAVPPVIAPPVALASATLSCGRPTARLQVDANSASQRTIEFD